MPGNTAMLPSLVTRPYLSCTMKKTIKPFLPTFLRLKRGTRLWSQVGDLQYEYEVTDMYVVSPEKISVLDQTYDASYITLITCVPPGTYWKRLVVRSKLVELP